MLSKTNMKIRKKKNDKFFSNQSVELRQARPQLNNNSRVVGNLSDSPHLFCPLWILCRHPSALHSQHQQQKPNPEFIEFKLSEYLVLTGLQLCGWDFFHGL